MSDDYEDGEYLSPLPFVPEKTEPIGLTLEGENLTATLNMIAAHTVQRIGSQKSPAAVVNAEVRKAIHGIVERVTEEVVRREVEGILADGWEEHTRWGSSTGKKTTLREFILEYATKRGSYGKYPHTYESTWLSEQIRSATQSFLDGELRKELDDAKVRLRKALDEGLTTKLADIIRSLVVGRP